MRRGCLRSSPGPGRGAEAELALDAAAEVGRPHERAVGVADSPAQRERVRRAAVGRARQRNGQVRDERDPQPRRPICGTRPARHRRWPARAVPMGSYACAGSAQAGNVLTSVRVPPRWLAAANGRAATHTPDPAAAMPRGELPTRWTWLTWPVCGSMRSSVASNSIADPYAVLGRDDGARPVADADGGGHPAGRRVESWRR